MVIATSDEEVQILRATAYTGIPITTLRGYLSGLTKSRTSGKHYVLTPLEEESVGCIPHEDGGDRASLTLLQQKIESDPHTSFRFPMKSPLPEPIGRTSSAQ